MLRTATKPRPAAEPPPKWPKNPTLTWSGLKRRFIWIGAPWHKEHPKAAGLKYNPDGSTWETADFDKAHKLIAWADEDTRAMLLDLAGTKAATAQAQADKLRDSRAVDADIDVPAPEGLEYMGFQRGGIAYAVKRFEAGQHGVLIGDEMGLGKTIQAVGLLNAMPDLERVLIVCPASLKINWRRELERWLVKRRYTGVAMPERWPHGAYIAIVNYDLLRKHQDNIGRIRWDLVIADEAHMAKNPEAQRTKLLNGIPARHRLYLTGTPIVNRPMELWPLVSTLAPGLFGTEAEYRKRYGKANVVSKTGRRLLYALQAQLREHCMVRRLKKDVLTDLPAKQRQVIELPASVVQVSEEAAGIMAFLEEIHEKQLAVELSKAAETYEEYSAAVLELKGAVQDWFASISTLRHQIALGKVPAITQHVRDVLESEGKVVLFAHHHDVIDAYVDAFKSIAVKVDGTMTGAKGMRERQAAVDAFQKDKGTRLFVGSLYAAGTGLTLTASSHVIFAELDWVPGVMSQAEDRCHRIGQQDNVLVQHLVLENSLDSYMAHRLVAKQKVIDASLDASEQAQLAEEPLVPMPDEHATSTVSWSRIGSDVERQTQVQYEAAGDAVVWLARRGQEMNRIDKSICEELDTYARLTPRQAALGRRVARKCRAQLPAELQEGLK